MDVLLQRHCAKYIYVIPDGLRELMSDISREVLRSQPSDMYTFIADYLDALLITRENARVAAKLVESITEIATTIVDFLTHTGMSREEADRVTTIIQRCFRKHINLKSKPESEPIEELNVVSEILDEANLVDAQAHEASIIIQRAYRAFRQRREAEKQMLAGMIDWRIAARSAIYLYRKTGVTNEEAHRAATLIKAAYKGYYTRRIMKRLLEEGQQKYIEEVGAYEVMSGDEAYTSDTDSRKIKDRQVTINYDTVIPHVDFDEPELIDDADAVDSSTVVQSIMDNIFSIAFPSEADEIEGEVSTSAPTGTTTPTYTEDHIQPFPEQTTEQADISYAIDTTGEAMDTTGEIIEVSSDHLGASGEKGDTDAEHLEISDEPLEGGQINTLEELAPAASEQFQISGDQFDTSGEPTDTLHDKLDTSGEHTDISTGGEETEGDFTDTETTTGTTHATETGDESEIPTDRSTVPESTDE